MENHSLPLVSVLMSVYNGEKHLEDSINSVFSQAFTNYEFLIINDGSTDKTREFLDKYSSKDSRIHLIHLPENRGLTAALNLGIDIAKGKWIARIDCDDIWCSDRLEKQINYLENNQNTKLLGTSFYVIDQKCKIVGEIKRYNSVLINRWLMLWGNCFIHSSVIFDKKIAIKLGKYDPLYFHGQDYDLWIKFAMNYDINNLEDTLISLRTHQESITTLNFKKHIKLDMVIKQNYRKQVAGNENYNNPLYFYKMFYSKAKYISEKKLIKGTYIYYLLKGVFRGEVNIYYLFLSFLIFKGGINRYFFYSFKVGILKIKRKFMSWEQRIL